MRFRTASSLFAIIGSASSTASKRSTVHVPTTRTTTITPALPAVALTAASNRSTVRTTITSTTTVQSQNITIAELSASLPIVTTTITYYTTVYPGASTQATSPLPHTLTNLTDAAPSYFGVPSKCVMICPPGFVLPTSPTFASNASSSGVESPTIGKTDFLYTPSTGEPIFQTTISPIANASAGVSGTPTCPNSMSHSVPAETEASKSDTDGALNSPYSLVSAAAAVR